mmetsp:Transcript_12885/g.41162  ORF Transcript_12885/g.41162 Transcript_12885/m.41162 type:complete len:702 (+) Transcript_12885:199-2304(+)
MVGVEKEREKRVARLLHRLTQVCGEGPLAAARAHWVPRRDAEPVAQMHKLGRGIRGRSLHHTAYTRRPLHCVHHVACPHLAHATRAAVGHAHHGVAVDAAAAIVMECAHVGRHVCVGVGHGHVAGLGGGQAAERILGLALDVAECVATVALYARVLEVVTLLQHVRADQRRHVVTPPLEEPVLAGEGLADLGLALLVTLHVAQHGIHGRHAARHARQRLVRQLDGIHRIAHPAAARQAQRLPKGGHERHPSKLLKQRGLGCVCCHAAGHQGSARLNDGGRLGPGCAGAGTASSQGDGGRDAAGNVGGEVEQHVARLAPAHDAQAHGARRAGGSLRLQAHQLRAGVAQPSITAELERGAGPGGGQHVAEEVDEHGAHHGAVWDVGKGTVAQRSHAAEQLTVQVVTEAEGVDGARARRTRQVALQRRQDAARRVHVGLAVREHQEHHVAALALGGAGQLQPASDAVPQVGAAIRVHAAQSSTRTCFASVVHARQVQRHLGAHAERHQRQGVAVGHGGDHSVDRVLHQVQSREPHVLKIRATARSRVQAHGSGYIQHRDEGGGQPRPGRRRHHGDVSQPAITLHRMWRHRDVHLATASGRSRSRCGRPLGSGVSGRCPRLARLGGQVGLDSVSQCAVRSQRAGSHGLTGDGRGAVALQPCRDCAALVRVPVGGQHGVTHHFVRDGAQPSLRELGFFRGHREKGG